MDTPEVKPVQKNMAMAILAYIGPLVVVSYLVAKDDPFVKFHIKQGLVLIVIEMVVWFLGMGLYAFWMIYNIVNLATFVLSILGIINVVHGKEKNLPLVGELSRYFTF